LIHDLCFLQVLSGFPRLFRGPLSLSLIVAPEHLWVYPSGSRRCWSLLIGHSSLLVANAFPWGRVSGPAGLAPEALQERECSSKGFTRISTSGRGICFNRHRRCFSRLWSRARDLYLSRSGHPRRCSRASSPRAWARLRRSRRALCLVLKAPLPSLRGTEGEVSTTPIHRVADCGFLVELLAGGSSGRSCLVR
jgi:hypothetical protein